MAENVEIGLESLSAEKIVSQIFSKEITVEEVVSCYLARISRFNPSLKAIVSLKNVKTIKEEAKNKKLPKTNKYPGKLLFGLPLAVKDLFDVKGLPTSYGLPEFKNNIATKNSIIVERLINHGAIIIGKTNTPELGVGSHTANKLFGVTANVYDTAKSAGGSSGGAASAVAASLVPFADGSDMMGSCRNPAAYANLYGFRPTPGLIPEYRNVKTDNKFPLLSTPGCLARTPNEMGLFLDAITGKHASDPFSFDALSSFRENQMSDDAFSKLKIGWLSDMNGYYEFEAGIIDMCEKVLHGLETTKVHVEHLKSQISPTDLWDSWTTLRAKNIFDELTEINLVDQLSLGFPVQWEYQTGEKIKFDDTELALIQRKKCMDQAEKLFKKFDFLVMPSAQIFPFKKELKYPEKISGHTLDTYHRWMEIVIFASLLGLPAISVPVGFNQKGLPMGMQIIGKKGDDLKVVSFAKKYEELFTFSQNRPTNFF